MDTDKKIDSIGRDIQYFDKMVDSSERLVKPYQSIVKWLIVGWAITVAIMGGIIAYQINQAYADPMEIDISQSQDFQGQTQEQQGKGAN